MNHMPTVYIVRHGESLATLDPSLFARMDPASIPLTQWGHEQAKEAGVHLARIFDGSDRKCRIFFSDHTRIVQSKDALVESLGGRHVSAEEVDLRLREREHGDFHGLDLEAQRIKNPEVFAKLYATGRGYARDRYETPMPNGESLKDVHARLNDFIASLPERLEPNEDVVIVTHGGNCKFLEHGLMKHQSVTLFGNIAIPEKGDVIRLSPPDYNDPQTIHSGKKRPNTMPGNYKSNPFGAPNIELRT